MRVSNFNSEVRRSARLASRLEPGRAALQEVGGVAAAGPRVRSSARSVASAPSRAPRRTVPERVRGPSRGGAQPQVPSLRAVSVVLERCDRLVAVGNVRASGQAAGNSAGQKGKRLGKRVRFADPPQTHTFALSPVEKFSTLVPPASLASVPAGAPTISSDKTVTSVSSAATTGVRILQLNMRRSTVVTGEVRQLVAEKRLDVLLLQEPYVRKQGQSHTFYGLGTGMKVAAVRSHRPWAAVAVCNPKFQMLFVSQLSTTHCVCAEVQAPGFSFYVASCYFQYSDEIEKHLGHLEMVCRSLRGKRLLVAVDANARSSLWGPQETDERGAKFEDLIRAFGLQVVNRAGQSPTFWTARGSSFIDVTLASPSMTQFVGEWNVRCGWTTSDHNAVDIRLRVPRVAGCDQLTANMRFDTRRADWEQFAERLADLSGSKLEVLALESVADVEFMSEALTDVVTEACIAAMPRKRHLRKSNPWWTRELTILKKEVYRLRRSFQSEHNEEIRLFRLREYRSSLRNYSRVVKKTKVASWRAFVTRTGNKQPWGFVYQQQADKLKVGKVLSSLRQGEYSTLTLEETAKCLLDAHIPDDRVDEDTPEQRLVRKSARVAPDTADAPFFTEVEVVAAVRSFKNNKAPGLDLIEVSVLKATLRTIPGQIVRLLNGCLQWGVFPSAWKEGSLRVLLKGEDRDEKDPKSYRPICLLSVVGKLFEKLLKTRLMDTSLSPGRVSDRQFGFTPGRSAEDAVVELRRMVGASERRYAVALLFDISGAFDNVWWPLVLDSLKQRSCPRNVFEVLQSYFDDRKVTISYGSVQVSKRATRGCPQGSVLGPACWNLMFDGLLSLLERSVGSNFVAYADDLLVLIEGDSRAQLERKGQQAVDLIVDWCRSAKLEISERKTEAIFLRNAEIQRAPIGRRGGTRPDRKRKTRTRVASLVSKPPAIKVGNSNIRFKEVVRYLGVHFSRGMGVGAHCRYLSDKLGSLFSKLGGLARAQWGLRFKSLSLFYGGVFVPTVTYAAAGWADLCTRSDVNVLRALQRRTLISATGAYRTASWESLCVVAGVVPVDILLQGRRAIYDVRKGRDAVMGELEIPVDQVDAIERVKDEAINMWQTRWSSSGKGRTTFAFFRDIRDRLVARWMRADHWSTQVLTGHGDFRERLASLGLAADGFCVCGGGEDTVGHFVLECPLFDAQREALRDLVPVSEWRWPEAARFFVSTPEAFAVLADFCGETLWLKGFE